MNILLTSVGRRGYLVNYFKEAFNGERKIFTSNSELTYTMKLSDGYFVSPLIYSEEYVDSIINYCKSNDISVVISLFDIDLLVLSKNEAKLKENGIDLILAPEESVFICNDKWESFNFFKKLGLKTPKTFLSVESALKAIEENQLSYPLIIKPRWGMASLGIFIADNENELKVLYDKSSKEVFSSYLKFESSLTQEAPVLIQELLVGKEYGLDVINDLDRDFFTCLAKEKVRMRAGETDLGLTVSSLPFNNVASTLSKEIKHRGILSVDVFLVNDEVYLTEMNCRISGHYPISHAVGFNFPKLLKAWLNNEKPSDDSISFEENVYVCKELSIKRLD